MKPNRKRIYALHIALCLITCMTSFCSCGSTDAGNEAAGKAAAVDPLSAKIDLDKIVSEIKIKDDFRPAIGIVLGSGLLLAVDDFSMGQTSIHYIKDNLFDIIKLDGSLIRELFTHQNSREIISSIVQLADTLHLSVIAEFVETEAQRDTLHELGCDIYQGYLYSPAVFLSNQDSAKAGQPLREKSVKRNASRSTITSNPAKTLMRR